MSEARESLDAALRRGVQDDGYGVLAVDDYWIVVLPQRSASFATREEAEGWMQENDE